ncbi:DUF4278 domain-containing protein [Leptothermofonsia sp. ETS-13]|uniref:DUF4278 domain-containing protein n=1 Tax=Leptothermofonsia sp. ETS-13 TaxID=3035696 RepID=UPI003B9FEA8D
MKLTYRGVSYESTQKPASIPAVDLRYRGANYRLKQVAKNENLNAILKYRGAAYTLEPTVQTATVPSAAVPAVSAVSHLSIEEQARFLTLNHHRAVKNRQQSMLRRSAAEAGLSAHIANYWNHIQGKVHPSFWMSYDRSHTALS